MVGGSREPFLVWTSHKNVAYIHGAKRVNSRHVRWVLFFTPFKSTLSYCPASHNGKPDARLSEAGHDPVGCCHHLALNCVVGVATWDVKDDVQSALADTHLPDGCPPVVGSSSQACSISKPTVGALFHAELSSWGE